MPGKMTVRGSRRKSANKDNPRYLTLEYLQKEVLFFVMRTPGSYGSPLSFPAGDAPRTIPPAFIPRGTIPRHLNTPGDKTPSIVPRHSNTPGNNTLGEEPQHGEKQQVG